MDIKEQNRANSHEKGEGFDKDTYSILDTLFEEDGELYVFTDNKYLSLAAAAFLEDHNFKRYSDDYENPILAINLEEGHFTFLKRKKELVEKTEMELPHDWTDFTKNVLSHLKDNPLVQKEEKEFVVNPVTKEASALDDVMANYKDQLDKLKEEKGISEEEVESLFNKKKDKLVAEMNKTTYTSTVDPSIKLRNGMYNTIVDLIMKNDWEDLFIEKYSVTPKIYVGNYGDVNVDKILLEELGFKYLIDDETIDIVDSEFMNNRSILVKYEGQK